MKLIHTPSLCFLNLVLNKITYKEKFARRPCSLLGVYPIVYFYSVLLQVMLRNENKSGLKSVTTFPGFFQNT